jgi:hypothetical protein
MRKINLSLYLLVSLLIISTYFVDAVLTAQQLTKNRRGIFEAWTNPTPRQVIISSISPDQQRLAIQQLQRQQLAAQQLAKRILPGLDPEIGPQYNKLVQEITRLTSLTVKTTVNGEEVSRLLTDTEIRKLLELQAEKSIAEGPLIPSEDFIGMAELDIQHIKDAVDSLGELFDPLNVKNRLVLQQSKSIGVILETSIRRTVGIANQNGKKIQAMYEDAVGHLKAGRYGYVEKHLSVIEAAIDVVRQDVRAAYGYIDQAFLIIDSGCGI